MQIALLTRGTAPAHQPRRAGVDLHGVPNFDPGAWINNQPILRVLLHQAADQLIERTAKGDRVRQVIQLIEPTADVVAGFTQTGDQALAHGVP